jgi:hypothetical protein
LYCHVENASEEYASLAACQVEYFTQKRQKRESMSPAAPRDATAFEVREAVREPGCAVCRLSVRSVARLLQSVAYEQVNDLSLRAALRKRGGFCNRHAYQWLDQARTVLGTALIYKDVLEAALRELDSPGSANSQRARRLRGLLGSTSGNPECPACRAQTEAETRYVDTLLALLASDADVVASFDASDGLCRRHTLDVVRSGRPGAEHVVRQTREALSVLIAELDEVIRKEDYRFRHEPRTDAERTAPARAIAWAAGLDGLTT